MSKEKTQLEEEKNQQPEVAEPETASPEVDQTKIDTQKRATAVERIPLSENPAKVIDTLQEQEKLPESIHTPHLVALLKFLGEKLKLRLNIGEDAVLYPNNKRTLDLKSQRLALFLKRGAAASVFMMPFVASSSALAQQLQPGMDLIDETTKVISEGSQIFHWENLLGLLLLLGVSTFVALKLIKKFKKTSQEKETFKKFEDYIDAKEKGDKDEIEKAKDDLFISTMSDLPEEMDKAKETADIESKGELKKAMKIKKETDKIIQDAANDIKDNMIIPDTKDINAINLKSGKVSKIIGNHIHKLIDHKNNLEKEAKKLPVLESVIKASFLYQQIQVEAKKTKYFISYMKLMDKKWLILIQNMKKEIIAGMDDAQLTAEDKLLKDVNKLKVDLDHLLDEQGEMTEDKFKQKIKELDEKLDEKIQDLPIYDGETTGKDIGKEINGDTLILQENGEYNHDTSIAYKANEKNHTIKLKQGVEVQIWINDQNKINMNFVYEGDLLETQELKIKNDELYTVDKDVKLSDYIEDIQKEKEKEIGDDTITGTAELGKEAEPMLQALGEAVENVNHAILSGSYNIFGQTVEMDDEAVDYHLMRVHREYFKGNPQTVIRFRLTDPYWKKTLNELDKQDDIPKNTVDFNFQDEKGNKTNINMPVRRFNVMVDKKIATVLVSNPSPYQTLNGEVRVIFDAKTKFKKEQVKVVMAEVAKRLGIQKHIKPVSEEAKDNLKKKLKEIRKEQEDPVPGEIVIHDEYKTAKVNPTNVETLKNNGLHCLYHQFEPDKMVAILKSGKLLSTSTRWSKGILKDGMSSTSDLQRGGGAEVFLRMHTKSSVGKDQWYNSSKPAIIFSPKLFQRLDCYCYSSDNFGSQNPGTFEQRISPAKLLSILNSNYITNHEVMFHDAVDIGELLYIVHDSPNEVLNKLKDAGITQIGGKPVEDIVISKNQFENLNNIE
ncbi:MAG: hypothetical protein V1679_02790 [Candidatus Peregrinibacteria bacterium]